MTLYYKYFNNFLNFVANQIYLLLAFDDILLLLNFVNDDESHWIQLSKSVFLVPNKTLLYSKKVMFLFCLVLRSDNTKFKGRKTHKNVFLW